MTQAAPQTKSPPAVLRATADGIATLTLNRPERYNTLSEEMLGALGRELAAVGEDESIRVVVLASTGKAFSTGHDLKEMRSRREERYFRELFARCAATLKSIVNLPQPVIARVQGIATAAGCQLVATCDLAVAGRSARFATSGINYGIFCTTPAVAVSRNVARKHALEMLLTGDFISAERAAEIGLINRIVDDDALVDETDALARRIGEKPAFSLRLGKKSFYRQLGETLDSAYEIASADIVCNLLSDDGKEGLDAFAEKRKPVWNQD